MKGMIALVTMVVTQVSLGAQPPPPFGPFAGPWVGEASMPSGQPVLMVMGLTHVLGDRVIGTLKVGDTDMVHIEDGRVRGDRLSFHRTLSDGTRVQFLARIIDDALRVRFIRRPAADARATGGSSGVVTFTAKRLVGSP